MLQPKMPPAVAVRMTCSKAAHKAKQSQHHVRQRMQVQVAACESQLGGEAELWTPEPTTTNRKKPRDERSHAHLLCFLQTETMPDR